MDIFIPLLAGSGRKGLINHDCILCSLRGEEGFAFDVYKIFHFTLQEFFFSSSLVWYGLVISRTHICRVESGDSENRILKTGKSELRL